MHDILCVYVCVNMFVNVKVCKGVHGRGLVRGQGQVSSFIMSPPYFLRQTGFSLNQLRWLAGKP